MWGPTHVPQTSPPPVSLTCRSLPFSRKPGREPKASEKPQRVISSGLRSSARYCFTRLSEKEEKPTTPSTSQHTVYVHFRKSKADIGDRGGNGGRGGERNHFRLRQQVHLQSGLTPSRRKESVVLEGSEVFLSNDFTFRNINQEGFRRAPPSRGSRSLFLTALSLAVETMASSLRTRASAAPGQPRPR